MKAVFGVPGELIIQKILFEVHPLRTYYYDCVDKKPKVVLTLQVRWGKQLLTVCIN